MRGDVNDTQMPRDVYNHLQDLQQTFGLDIILSRAIERERCQKQHKIPVKSAKERRYRIEFGILPLSFLLSV
jgi:hypothetical protein